MPRVLVDGSIYQLQPMGGINRYFEEILQHVGDCYDNIEVLLHLPSHHFAQMIPTAPWIRPIKDGNLRPGRVFRQLGRMRTRLARPDIFHSTFYTRPYWKSLKSVVTVYDLIEELYYAPYINNTPFLQHKRQVIESADMVIAISETTRQDILEHMKIDEEKIITIYPGINETFFMTTPPTVPFDDSYRLTFPYWLYIGGRHFDHKNVKTLIEAFVQTALQCDLHLVLVGGQPCLEPSYLDVLRSHNLEQRVHLLSSLDDAALRGIYNHAVAVVVPSFTEGFGLPVVEGMACGTPVLASEIPIFREIGGEAIYYFDPHDAEALANAMLQVLNGELRNHLSFLGRQHAQRYSWRKAAEQLGAVYHQVANS